tara:strand:- start:2960 stop:4237 length:1278 start_codon:yes stop_codon:yes gene_type:complete
MAIKKKNLLRLVIFCSIPLLGIVAAFGISANESLKNIPIQRVILDLPLLHLPQINEKNIVFWQQERIQKNDRVASLLTRLKINKEDKLAFLHDARNIKAMRQLIPGKTIHAQTSATGELLTFRYFSGGSKQLVVKKINGNFIEDKTQSNIEIQIEMKLGVIKSSLFAATDGANIPDGIATQISEIFASDIDFNRDLRKNDRFKVIYERRYNNGEPIGVGKVLAAEFTNKKKTYQAVYFESNDKEKGYYTPDGKNLRRTFLRSPLKFSRISSKFSHSRYHPILKKWRSHKGVDYAARKGTPVRATANGIVTISRKERGYGNLIVLKHRRPYSTAYAHLSSFAKGIRKGKRVTQGDIIGYVGSTGLATGPHLHYEFRVNGIQRNPLSVVMPAAIPLSAKNLPIFKKNTKPLIARLNILRDTNLASLD